MADDKNSYDWPTIDVVIPVFNGENYIIDAVRSVDKQTYPPKRIIVVDDGSTDSTASILAAYSGSVTIELIRQENRGLSAARNAGIRHSNSDYIAFIDSDDEWHPEKLEEQVKLFMNNSFHSLGVVYCNYCIFDDRGKIENAETGPELRGKIFERLLGGNRISGSGSSVMVKRECFNRVGLFDERLKACEDWDMWLRLATLYEFDFTPKTLVRIRKHAQNMQKDKNFMFRNSLIFYDKWCIHGGRNIVAWRNSIVYRIAEELPNLTPLHLTRNILSGPAKQILFKVAFGCIEVFLLLRIITIMIIILKRILRIKEYA